LAGNKPLITNRIRWLYGFGSVAYGVKENGFAYLLLFYYSQVLGLSGTLTGLALLIALLFDAVSDPLVGFWSDNTHSRWGRRHPFMYASVVPVGISFYFLWNPPLEYLSETGLFVYLCVIAIFVRFFITLYEIPSTAIVAEITDDYDERTRLLGLRYMFGWQGGLCIALLAWGIFLAATDEFPYGAMNPAGYPMYGLAASCMIVVSILVSTIGLHRFIPFLQAQRRVERLTARRMFLELRTTLANKDFLVLFAAGLFTAIAWGASAGFDSYINNFFWGFPSEKIFWLNVGILVSAVVAAFLAPMLAKRYDKKRTAIGLYIAYMCLSPALIALRLLDVLPGNDWPYLFPLVMFWVGLVIAIYIMFGIVQSSMLADVVEQSQMKTGRREEGLFFAARTFSQKAATGIGTFMVGIILDVISFPKDLKPGEVSQGVLFDLGFAYGTTMALMPLFAIIILSFYGITRADHVGRVKKLDAVASSQTEIK